MSISDRLRVARASLGLSQKAVAEQSGVSTRGYQGYEDGRSIPGGEAIAGFVKLGINANWLLTGEGEMFYSETRAYIEPAPKGSEATEWSLRAIPSGFVAIMLEDDIYLPSGGGAVVGDTYPSDNALMFKEDWIRLELNAKPSDLRLIRVRGNSMEPTLRAGDCILIDLRARRPDCEGIYILRMGEMLLVKNVQALPGGKIRITSDNPQFEPFILNMAKIDSDATILGRVVWVGRCL
ncbi:MAG: helix-turn-helix domain-containing protein [Candidatus Accumulibacter sp.]|jgi:phage repressor protein C with HTH and peptisase S24 domain|nr:helix-turn-helix domain-containing protein [Accumulibacter sp.]